MIRIRQVFLLVGCFLSTLGACGGSSAAVDIVGNRTWVQVSQIQLSGGGNYHDLAFDGSQWHIASGLHNFWWNFSPSFSLQGTTTVSAVSDMRGLAYDAALNQLVITDQDTGIIRFVDLAGTVHSQFSAGSFQTEGLDFDNRDSTIWLARFDGQIEHWSSSGQLLFGFNGLASLPLPNGWSSVAIDPATNHLFAMNDNDAIYEFTMTGQLLGKIIDDPFPGGDGFTGNGLGLNYDPVAMLLRTTSQAGGLVTFHGLPEPSTIVLAMWIAGVVAGSRNIARRRSANR
jgi:hypothetical protein